MDGLHSSTRVGIPVVPASAGNAHQDSSPAPVASLQADSFAGGGDAAPALVLSPASATRVLLPALAIPDGDGLLILPSADGSCTATHKVPATETRLAVEMVDTRGESLRLVPFAEGSRTAVTCLGTDGTVRWRHALPDGDRVGQIVPDPTHDRVLVRTGTSLVSLDATDGQEKARRDFGSMNFCRTVLCHSNGEIVVTSDKSMLRLDALGLADIDSRSLSFRPSSAQEMADGSVFLLADNCPTEAVVLGSRGETLMEAHDAALHSTVVDDQGDIWMVNNHDLESVVKHQQKSILHYDASTHAVSDFPATRETTAVVPRKDGSYLVFHDALSHPALQLHAADGTRGPRFTFKEEGFLRQFLLTEDERHAYAVIDRYSADHRSEHSLARFDLPAPGASVGSLLGRLNPFGESHAAETLYTSTQSKQFLPAVLDDGRILVFREDGVDLLDATGTLQKTVPDVNALLPELHGASVVTRGIRLGTTQDPDLPPSLESVLKSAQARFGLAGPPPPSQAGDANPRDNCLEFPVTVSEAQAASVDGLPSRDEMEQLLLDQHLVNFALTNELTLPYPDSAGDVLLTQDCATVRVPDGTGGTSEHRFTLESGTTFTAALPVRVGQHFCLAAGTSDGRLRWYEAGDKLSGVPSRVFDVGAPVVRIDLARDRVRALGSDGRTLLFRPAESSRGLRAVAAESSSPRAHVGAPPAQDGVVVQDDRVIIGGVAISRNRTV